MRELHHNAPEQVKGYLDDALTILNELAPEPDLRPIVFAKAVDLLAAKQIFADAADVQPIAAPVMAIPRGRPL